MSKMELYKEGSTSKASNKLVINSVAFYDHITHSLLQQGVSLSDPLLGLKRKAPRNPQARGRVEERLLQREEDEEYVLDAAPPPLTLGKTQKLGLVASPAGRLTEDEWTQVKARSIQQGESSQPCAVCREEFLLQPQVLLSCSHVFHRACVQAFERFSGRRCCPMCRKEQYETRVIHDAAQLFRHQSATRIQACWRGYVARKRYKKLRRSICPKDKQLRRKFFEEKLQELNDSFVRYCHTDTEAFLSDINRSLSSSRRVFQQLERKHVSEPRENDWERIQSQVIQRGVWDCPICLIALSSPSLRTEGDTSSHRPHRPTVLLSCSHVFHQLCLEAFEAFTTESRPSCPVCRSVYHKKLI
ncbi:RING finger protein 32 isoform X1 [Acanthopagrus latus]|uniref:RING finger protein 32 isoform X1 n=1 Tax=Acanthopagrus latus TaxID=8177 RepID=UPI00187C532C|nr:RING finger protein 32 isoform X1 [Acanthopagrus latus]XP_036934385.1 RING finger protein 32 isoform X1 [Acanthopagrus latus]